jgi:2-methylcitrate dehydratase PrpD
MGHRIQFLPNSGLDRDQTIDVISQAFVDGQSLRTYRHAPNTGSRKSWAAGDACSRAVNLALLVKKGEMGLPGVLTAKTWGFYDVLFKVRLVKTFLRCHRVDDESEEYIIGQTL